MHEILWQPTQSYMEQTNIRKFMRFAQEQTGVKNEDYPSLYRWSVEDPTGFWGCCWKYFGVIASKPYTHVLEHGDRMPGARWFTGARLNYAENLLRWHDQPGPAIVFRNELGERRELSRSELYRQVIHLAEALRSRGVGPGDLVAAYMPNLPETVIAMLAAVAVGAAWCSCATDIGVAAATDRLAQLKPKVLFAADGYTYKGKTFDVQEKVAEIQKQICAEQVIMFHYQGNPAAFVPVERSVSWEQFLSQVQPPRDFQFEQLPGDAPLFVMFSSGTTGKPKCMVHSQAGVLVNQLKELILQNDMRPLDPVLYVTTCSWMMWNWQLASLAMGGVLTLYEGSVFYPDAGAIWRILEQEKVALFGLSASYIHALMKQGVVPMEEADLQALRCISQTGSALQEDGFRYIYEKIKKDLHFSSISGGTDINGSFISGNPLMPVRAGELQMPALGMPVACFNEAGEPVWDQKGELVCVKPIPTMPLCFVNDPDGEKYHASYFDLFPGVWRHGDYVMFHSDTLGVSFYGRSDSVLKPSGVRIGTAEIYNIVNRMDEIEESLAVGQLHNGDQRIILFVKMKEGLVLDEALIRKIKQSIRLEASPHHVPAVIIQCPEYPRTINGKLSESAVRSILNGGTAANRTALANPEILAFYEEQAKKLS